MRQVARFCALAVGLVMFFTSAPVFAQSDNASISGFVKDASGSSVPTATITIKNEATGVERRTKVNETGYYVVGNLPPAYYTIRVEAAGFRTYEQSNTKLDPGISIAVEVSLQVGALNETIQVTASATVLQSESAAVGGLVSRSQIDNLELNGRNPVLLAGLVPGTRGGALNGLSFNFSQGPSNFNGSRNPENLITYDGAPATRTRSNGTSLGAADVDSVQEVQVLTANYGAEYGRSSGGQIRIVTRSGTTQFHGAFYDYFRHDALNANTWSRNSSPQTAFVPPFRYNQYGYNLGGPLYIPNKFNKDKNKFFWYWGQEWVKYRPTDTVFQTVPTDSMRNGNFSELLDPRNVWYGRSVTLFDPSTCPSVGAAGCTAFPGNVIPQNRLSPNGIALLRAYPTANLSSFVNGSNNWYGAATHPYDQRKDTLAVDMNLSPSDRITFRRLNFAYLEYQPFDGGSDRVPKFFNRPNQTNSLNYTKTIRPTLINEALATVSLDNVYIPIDTAKVFDRSKAGINYPYLFPDGKEVGNRIPDLVIPNFYGLTGGPYPSHSTGPIYTFSDTLSWVKGSHTFKFGFAYEKSGENDFDQINVSGVPGGTNNQNGRFAFSDTRTGGGATSGVGIGNAALGLFDVYAEIGRRSYTIYRGSMWEAFAQDSWKVNRKLHIDYGVRWTVIVPYHALWNNMDVFDPTFYDASKAVRQDPRTGYVIPGSGDRYNGIVIPGSGFPSSAKGRVGPADSGDFNNLFRAGVPDYYSDIHYTQFQPRLGVAYNLNDKTVIRSGIGRYLTRLGVSDSVFLGGNPPFQPIGSVSLGSVDNPGGGAQNQFPLTVTTQTKAFYPPEAWNWNFTVERQTILKSIVSVAYVGRRGLHLQQERDINQLQPGTIQANPGINPDFLRPYKGFAVIRQTDNTATSRYNSLQVAWNRRFTQGLSFSLAYTYAKSLDDGSAQRDILPNSSDRAAMWGPSDFDTHHTVIMSQLYELPFFHNSSLSGKVLGGWQLSAVEQFQTGTPSSVGTGDDTAGVGTLGSMSGLGQAWVVNGNPSILGGFAANGNADPTQYFQTKNPDGSPIFTRAAAGTFNSQRVRNLIFGPGFQNWNLGLFKKFAITEKMGFQFRAEGYNFINHPNWAGPNRTPTAQAFGKVTSKSSERNLQLSLRFYF